MGFSTIWHFVLKKERKENVGCSMEWTYDKDQTLALICYLTFGNINSLSKCLFQFSSVTQSCPTPCNPIKWGQHGDSMPGLPVHHQLPEFTQTHIHGVGDAISHLILCHPLLLLLPIPPIIRVISNESTHHMRWPKFWSFSFSISPSNGQSGLISFRMDWLDLLAVQGTLRVFSNTTVQKHQFFGAQLSSLSNSHIHTWLLEKS